MVDEGCKLCKGPKGVVVTVFPWVEVVPTRLVVVREDGDGVGGVIVVPSSPVEEDVECIDDDAAADDDDVEKDKVVWLVPEAAWASASAGSEMVRKRNRGQLSSGSNFILPNGTLRRRIRTETFKTRLSSGRRAQGHPRTAKRQQIQQVKMRSHDYIASMAGGQSATRLARRTDGSMQF